MRCKFCDTSVSTEEYTYAPSPVHPDGQQRVYFCDKIACNDKAKIAAKDGVIAALS